MEYGRYTAEPASNIDNQESGEQRERHLTWERVRIAEGDANIAAGRVIAGDEDLEWLDRWAAGEDLEEPSLS
jgi:predicted transcriptional regulator